MFITCSDIEVQMYVSYLGYKKESKLSHSNISCQSFFSPHPQRQPRLLTVLVKIAASGNSKWKEICKTRPSHHKEPYESKYHLIYTRILYPMSFHSAISD